MSQHNYFVSINGRIKGIFAGDTAAAALDNFARSELFSSWQGREICRDQKDDFAVWRIEDFITITDRTPEACPALWLKLERLGRVYSRRFYYPVIERSKGKISQYPES